MRLLRLEARNFRSFAELDLDLNASGVFSITGPNGAGKSTIFAAIEWALYGGGRGPAQNVARDGVEREECSVTLEFEVAGQLLRVTRIDGKDAWLTDVASEERLAQTLSGTSREVAVRLGLTKEMFRGTFYARQNEVEALGGNDPRKRKDQLERLLGIRHLRRAVELAEADAREQGLVLEGLRRDAPDVEELKAEVKQREKEAKEAAPAVKRLKREVAAHEKKLKETNKGIDQLAAQLAEHASRQLEAERAEGVFNLKNEALESKGRELRAALDAREEETELEAALNGGEDLEARERELVLLRQNHERRQALMERERDALEELAAATDALDDRDGEEPAARLREARDRRAEANAEIAHQQRHREALDGADGGSGVCPTCHRELNGSAGDLLAAVDAAIAAARRRRDQLNAELAELEGAEAAHREAQGRAIKAQEGARLIAEQLGETADDGYDPEAHAEVKAALEKRQELLRRLAVARDQAAGAELLEKQFEAQRKEVESVIPEVMKLREAAEQLAPEPGAQEKMSAERDALQAQLDAAREQLEQANLLASSESESVAAARARLKDADRLARRIDEERRELELRTAIAGALEEYREEASRRARPMLEAEASKLLRQTTEATYPRIRLTEGYFLEIADGRHFYPSRRFSGGEQDLAALCLRLALARTLAHQRGAENSFVILDEVFGSQDVGRRRLLMEQLLELSKGEFQQIFVISHTDDIVDLCSLNISVKREHGISRAFGPSA